MIRPIQTDLVANSVEEIDNLWRAVAHCSGGQWKFRGLLESNQQDKIIFRTRAFEGDRTISVATGPAPGGGGYVLYARQMPSQYMVRERRV